MKHYYKNICLLLLLVSSFGIAQEKKIKKANEEFSNFAYVEARDAYLKVANSGFRSEELLKQLGDSYYFTADYSQAATWYGALYDANADVEAEYLYRYAQSLKSDEQYDLSDQIMEVLYAKSGEDNRASMFANERNYLDEIEKQSGRFELVKVGFNSALSDFAPSFRQGQLVFASNRTKDVSSARLHQWNDEPFLDLYIANKSSVSDVDSPEAQPERFSSKINTKFHESTAVFTKDGGTMYFTRNNFTKNKYREDANGTNKLKLYRAVQTGGDWDVVELPFNSDQYSVAHPALSTDEKTLYFASDMPGTRGMSDLYKVEILSDGGFGEPVSLGAGINTEGRETFPFVSADNKLYFASDGHIGLGGLDVFVADIKEDSFGEVYNLGRPVNSPQDDFTFVINSKTGVGYFASNREGGVGNDDIYSFKNVKGIITSCEQSVTGVVVDKNTKEPIANAKVVLMDAANQVIDQLIAGDDGSFSFPLNCKTPYCVRGSKVNYGFDEECFTTTAELALALDLTLEIEDLNAPKIGDDLNLLLDLDPIYFDLDKDFIRADAQIELQKVIKFMRQYPTVKIDVRSHTDSRNTDAYNMDLSSRRNANTIAFIANRGGIDRSRLTGRGYGESQLTNHCEDGVSCSEALHQLNRRSEFIIVEK